MKKLIAPQFIDSKINDGKIIYRYSFEKKVSGFFYALLSCDCVMKLTFGPYDFCKVYSYELASENCKILCNEIFSLQFMDIELPLGVTLSEVGIIDATYDYQKGGYFKSDDEHLNKIWEVGAYTVSLCTHRHRQSASQRTSLNPQYRKFINEWTSEYGDFVIFDGPRRDRECWIGDIRTEALAVYSAFLDASPVKASIKLFSDLQLSDGIILGSAATRQHFLEYSFWWVISVYECFLYTADKDFLSKTYPNLLRFFDTVLKISEQDGLVDNDNSWMWTFVRVGKVGSVQCVLYHALNCISLCAKAMDDERVFALSKAQAEKVKNTINRRYWNEEKGVYDDEINFYTPSLPVFLDFNCFALCFGIADKQKSERILDYLKKFHHSPCGSTTTDIELSEVKLTDKSCGVIKEMANEYENPNDAFLKIMWPHNKKVWPFMVGYEVEARFLFGDDEGAFDLINKCWGTMIDQNASTFWEMLVSSSPSFPAVNLSYGATITQGMNSACHGWSGWITHILSKFVLGVIPLSEGFKTFTVIPHLNGIKALKGAVPTPFGTIDLDIKDDKINLTYPKSLEFINKTENFIITENKK